jgi:hypothetical protein
MKNNTKLKDSTIASAFLLATGSAWASPKMGVGQPPSSDESEPPSTPPPSRETRSSRPAVGGGKTQLGALQRQKFSIESITLDKVNQRKITTCRVPTIYPKKPRPKIKDVLSLSYNPNRRQLVTLQFEMSNIPAGGNEERVLVLLYSRCLTKRPKIKTQFSKKKLALDTNDIEIMGTYDIPTTSDTTKGKDKSSATTSMTIEVDLETNKLTPQVNAGNDTFYFQAALLKKTDFDRKYYGTMTLSPPKAIHVNPKSCLRKKQFSSNLNSDNESCKQLPTKTD